MIILTAQAPSLPQYDLEMLNVILQHKDVYYTLVDNKVHETKSGSVTLSFDEQRKLSTVVREELAWKRKRV